MSDLNKKLSFFSGLKEINIVIIAGVIAIPTLISTFINKFYAVIGFSFTSGFYIFISIYFILLYAVFFSTYHFNDNNITHWITDQKSKKEIKNKDDFMKYFGYTLCIGIMYVLMAIQHGIINWIILIVAVFLTICMTIMICISANRILSERKNIKKDQNKSELSLSLIFVEYLGLIIVIFIIFFYFYSHLFATNYNTLLCTSNCYEVDSVFEKYEIRNDIKDSLLPPLENLKKSILYNDYYYNYRNQAIEPGYKPTKSFDLSASNIARDLLPYRYVKKFLEKEERTTLDDMLSAIGSSKSRQNDVFDNQTLSLIDTNYINDVEQLVKIKFWYINDKLKSEWLFIIQNVQFKGLLFLFILQFYCLSLLFLIKLKLFTLYESFETTNDIDIIDKEKNRKIVEPLIKEGAYFMAFVIIIFWLMVPFFKQLNEQSIDLDKPYINFSLYEITGIGSMSTNETKDNIGPIHVIDTETTSKLDKIYRRCKEIDSDVIGLYDDNDDAVRLLNLRK